MVTINFRQLKALPVQCANRIVKRTRKGRLKLSCGWSDRDFNGEGVPSFQEGDTTCEISYIVCALPQFPDMPCTAASMKSRLPPPPQTKQEMIVKLLPPPP